MPKLKLSPEMRRLLNIKISDAKTVNASRYHCEHIPFLNNKIVTDTINVDYNTIMFFADLLNQTERRPQISLNEKGVNIIRTFDYTASFESTEKRMFVPVSSDTETNITYIWNLFDRYAKRYAPYFKGLSADYDLPKIEKYILDNLRSIEWKTMYIDYHEPFVSRLWFQYDTNIRVYLHLIEPCTTPTSALYHPHPWHSVIRLVKGHYEMGIGHSETNATPETDCKLFIGAGTTYEMNHPDGWHYVRPLKEPVYSIMVTSKMGRRQREMPLEPEKDFRELTEDEKNNILDTIETYLISKYL